MSEQWIKSHLGFDDHPDTIELNHTSRCMLQFLWRKAKSSKVEGTFSEKFLRPSYIAKAINVECEHCKAAIGDSIDALFDAGQLIREGDEMVRVPNWEKYQSDPTNKNRQKRYKDKHRAEQSTSTVTEVTENTVSSETGSPKTCSNGNNRSNAVEEMRGDERRVEEKIIKKEAGDNGEKTEQAELPSVPTKKLPPRKQKQRDQIRDIRAQEFFDEMRTVEIDFKADGMKKIVDTISNPEALANRVSDVRHYPLVTAKIFYEGSIYKQDKGQPIKDTMRFFTNWAKKANEIAESNMHRSGNTGTSLDPSSSCWLPYAGGGK